MESNSESNMSNGAPAPEAVTETNGGAGQGDGGATKPVNPLRLARPLEKTGAGLSKTSIPASRPLPMPTISPLCPPGHKNGVKALPPAPGAPTPSQENTSPPAPGAPAPSQENSSPAVAESEKTAEKKKDVDHQEKPSTHDIDSADKEKGKDNPKTETKSEPDPVQVDTSTDSSTVMKASRVEEVVEQKEVESNEKKDDSVEKTAKENGKVEEKEVEKIKLDDGEKEGDKKKPEEKNTITQIPPKKTATPKNGTQLAASPTVKKKVDGPKIPVAEKTPRQTTKRKKSLETDTNDDEKRTSKRSRAPPDVFKAADPEMDHILKTIKKQEEEAAKKVSDKTVAEPEKKTEKSKKQPTIQPATKTSVKTSSRKKRKVSESEESETDYEEESEEEDDFKPVKAKAKKTPPKKPIRKSKMNNTESASRKTGKKEPVFFKDEHLAVRNDEGAFYLCKTMQNIYIGSRNIKIQWLSNEDHIIPAKENPDQDIYAPDFYDKTDFETILTSVELDKVLGKSKRMILPEEELARIEKILQRSNDKAEGKLDMSNIELTEDNPDGLDISLYKGEDQLDEIEKRKNEKDKITKKVPPSRSKKKSDNENAEEGKEEEKDQASSRPEPSKGRGRPKKDVSEEKQNIKQDPAKTEEVGKRGRRKASKNVSYDQYDFLEEEDDEVIPKPKKRKSQDSVSEPIEKKEEKVTEKTESKEDKKSENKDGLSTSEKAILAEQKKTEEDSTSAKDSAEPGDTEEPDSNPVKKRGRKPKAKE